MEASLSGQDQVAEWVEGLIKQHKVCVFSTSGCPYCHKAILALQSVNAKDMHIEQVDRSPFMDAFKLYMKQTTGAGSFPRVFIGGKFLGGGDDTARAKNDGSLVEKLRAAGAL